MTVLELEENLLGKLNFRDSMPELIKILVADDHKFVLKSLVTLLNRQPDMQVVATATNGQEAVELAQNTEADIIILDVSMPVLDGIRAARQIQELNLHARIIMLSMHHNSTLVQQAQKYGAVGYVMKQEANRKLIPSILAAHDGEDFF